MAGGAQLRQVLAGQAQHRRTVGALQRQLPAFSGFDGVARAESAQVRNAAQRCQMFDRLMGRAVFAKADGIMRHHIGDADAHQRSEADGGARIIGEHHEGAANRYQAAVQRNAVHGRSHAMFADAPADVAALEVFGVTSSSKPLALVLLDGVKSAEPDTSSGIDGLDRIQRQFRGLAGGNSLRVGKKRS